MDEEFSASTPTKGTRSYTEDSGVSVQLSDMSHSNSSGSEEGEPLHFKTLRDADVTVIKISGGDDDDFSDDEDTEALQSMSLVGALQEVCGSKLKWGILILLGLCYSAYFVAAIVLGFSKGCAHSHNVMPLIYLTIAGLAIALFSFVSSKFSDSIASCFEPLKRAVDDHWHVLKWVCCAIPLLGVVAVVIVSAVQSSSNLVSLVGWFFFIGFLLACSKAPRKIKWRPVLGGFALQFFFAVLILKWSVGYNLFYNLGSMFRHFLGFSEFGAKFVLGSLDEHLFAFKVLPVIIFFSCVITMLYYLGVMQAVIGKLAFVMRVTLGTTAAESMCAAGNIFVGQTEAPILIRPFLMLMTRSELHAVMVGGFSTIAGAVLAAYIMKGVPATHLLTASVMNAPAALAVSKILYPELARSKITKMNQVMKDKQPYNNVIEAAAAGASSAISLVANVAANLIAFVALLNFVDSAISWFGAFICIPELSFQLICNYALRPLAFIMGVEWSDAGYVAELIGVKTFLNEFYAYDQLSDMITNRVKCLAGPAISVRSEVIATYALCGFANLSSIGIQLGGLGPMAPSRLGDLARIAMSALMGGIVTNLMTACLAGLLVVDTHSAVVNCLNATMMVPVVNATLDPSINATLFDAIVNTTSLI